MIVDRPIRIGNCSGFFGDRSTAAREMVEGGPLDVLTGDWLAELTMFILSRIRAKRPNAGYARTFVEQMEQVMGSCMDKGIRIVSNAGGLDPLACAERLAEVAARLGLHPTIAFVSGDDLMDRFGGLLETGALKSFGDSPRRVDVDASSMITANAYLGGWGIAQALASGADIVITGRVTDAALVSGPASWYHGWAPDDWDALAGAVVAGHVIECGAQATGGNYSFFQEVPGLDRPGFPWAEIFADGSSIIGKHDGTGGEVSLGTVTSQLLYEIQGHRYEGPDVVARFDSIGLEAIGPDRVRIAGTMGLPPSGWLKVAANRLGGYRNEMSVALTGLDIEDKAQLVEAAFWRACPVRSEDIAHVETTLDRTDHEDPTTNAAATARWRVVVTDPDPSKIGRSFANALTETGLSSVPGMYMLSGSPSDAVPYAAFQPLLVDAASVAQTVTILGGSTISVASPPTFAAGLPPAEDVAVRASSHEVAGDTWEGRPSTRVPLGRVVGARSGDKGGNANLGVFARDSAAWPWLARFLTIERLRALLPEIEPFHVERHLFANLYALNFVVSGILGDGAAASTRVDNQAKSLSEWLRARHVSVPNDLLA